MPLLNFFRRRERPSDDLRERLDKLERRVRAFDVEMEDFVAKVSRAAKRAYARDHRADDDAEPKADDRSARKARILGRVR